MSSSFTSSSTRGLSNFEREIEKRLDVFTDDFSPPGSREGVPGLDFRKPGGGYQKPHEDTDQENDQSRNHSPQYRPMAAAGLPQDQEPLDDIDDAARHYEDHVKKYGEQFPGAREMLEMASVDEGLWNKAKSASQQAFGKIKWPFVQWWYKEHGGK
jgi:hypothetical protein